MIFSAWEEEDLAAAQHAAWLAHAQRKPMATLQIYNRVTQQVIAHTAPVLRVTYNGIIASHTDVSTQLGGGWKDLGPALRDGARISLMLHLPDTQTARNLRGNLLGAMIDQSLEKFTLLPGTPNRLGAGLLTFWAFVFVARNLGLSDAPTAIVDLELSGELLTAE